MNPYQEEILDHYHNPRNHGVLKNATHHDCALNATCGDKICIDLIIKKDVIKGIKFSGEGCAISQAAASMLTEAVCGKPLPTLENFTKDAMLELLSVELSPSRLRCGLLALECAQKALGNSEEVRK